MFMRQANISSDALADPAVRRTDLVAYTTDRGTDSATDNEADPNPDSA